MGREIRLVSKDWKHPKKDNGRYDPLYDSDFGRKMKKQHREDKENWNKGLVRNWVNDTYNSKSDEQEKMSWEEYCLEEGMEVEFDKSMYMPFWKEEELTHMAMYEDTSEGTPISPVFKREESEEMAKWLVDNEASAFGDSTASYKEWLNMIEGSGFAVGMVISNGVMMNGVEADLLMSNNTSKGKKSTKEEPTKEDNKAMNDLNQNLDIF